MTPLDALRAEVAAHPSNAAMTALGWEPLVVADPAARILIISQAPGRLAQESGIPWNDPSGRLLRSWMGVTDEQFYDPRNVAILPMDFYFPGKAAPAAGGGSTGDLPPRRGFAEQWHPRFLAEMTEVRLTLLIGAYAQRHYLSPAAGASLTERVRAAESHLPYFPIVHPSPLARGWRTRNPWFETETAPRLAQLVREALA